MTDTALALAAAAVLGAGWLATAVYARTTKTRLTRKHQEAHNELTQLLRQERALTDALKRETAHLVDQRIPAALDAYAHQASGVSMPGLLHPDLSNTAFADAHDRVLQSLAVAADIARKRIQGFTLMSLRYLLDDAQAYAVRAQHQCAAESERHPNSPAVQESLMRLDHQVTMAMAYFQRLRILGGAFPGAQRADSPIFDIIEAARARVVAYQEIKYTVQEATDWQWVSGNSVEAIVVALSELLRNASTFSHRYVDVIASEVHRGIVIEVSDRGSGLNVYQREEANRIMRGDLVFDVTNADETPQVGFFVIGRLAAEYGFEASITGPSGFGGTRAVILIPWNLIVEPPENPGRQELTFDQAANPDMTRDGARQAAAATTPTKQAPTSPSTTSGGLPKRRRTTTATPPPPPVRKAEDHTGGDAMDMVRGLEQLTGGLSLTHEQNENDGK